MGLFAKRQSDESWLAEIKPSFDAALPLISTLDVALDNDALEDQYSAVQHVVQFLPLVQKSVKQIRGPSSSQAQHVHKSFKLALNKYVDSAKQGLLFFRDLGGGPGQRASGETGMARRAAVGWLTFSETMFKEIAKTGRNHKDVVSSYLN